jgi:hypothetical protein
VIDATGTTLKQRRNDHNAKFGSDLAKQFSGWARDRFRKLEMTGIFCLAKIQAAMQFLQQHQLRALLRRTLYTLNACIEIRLTTVSACLLHQSDGQWFVTHGL